MSVEKFISELAAVGSATETLTKYQINLRQFSEVLGKDFEACTKDDIIRALAWLERQPFKPGTKSKKKEHLKRYFQWLRGCERKQYPPEVSWFTTSVKYRDRIAPEDVLTEEEILQAIEKMPSVRNKALFSFLYDIGPRPHEFLKLRIQNTPFDDYSYTVRIPSGTKTGFRRVRGTISTPYLKQWLGIHPRKKEMSAPLFVVHYCKKEKAGLSYDGLRRICQMNAKYFPDKRIYPYVFRHSRATHLAKIMTEAQLCQHFGWAQGSRMPRIYVHLSGRDLDATLLGAYGLKEMRKEEQDGKPRRCPICQEINPPNADTCWKCLRPLDIIQGEEELLDRIIQRMQEKGII
ncbi:MAG: tyrosine-type recombinase/integrase [Methanobacteriota archaeon]